MKITGELRAWSEEKAGPRTIYWGDVYGDIKGRFADGTTIHTSYVKKLEDCGDHFILVTRNSVYKLMKDQSVQNLLVPVEACTAI